MLTAQAVTLNALFTTLVTSALKGGLSSSSTTATCGRHEAQAHYLATLDTFAAIKNPPTVFARQANIAKRSAADHQLGRAFGGASRAPMSGNPCQPNFWRA
jgi:hypothetical protein